MRKLKLLLTITALLFLGGISVNAQLTNGTVYWIQDISTGQFLSQGDNWSTRAVMKDVGGLGWEAVYISDGVYKLQNIMWNTVRNQTKGLGSDLYVDNGSPAQFTLTASGNGYKVSLNGNYWVNNGGENAYKEKPLGTTTDAAAASVWKFLTKTEYDAAIQAYKDGKAASYAAALGYSVSTVSELETLISDAEEFMSKDYTSSIKNPTLGSNGDNWTHGTVSQRSEGWNVGNGCAEFWNGCGYCKQTVSGLPNGLYKVTFVGSYRPANKAEALNLVSEKTSSPAFVYANDAKVEFLHWIDVPAQANGRGDITVANGYQNSLYTYVTDGTLTLGIVADGYTDVPSWTTFGQFTLTQYYSVASYKLAYNEAMTAATTASETLDGFTLYATQKSTLDGIITANTLTGDDLSDIDKLTEATINLNNASLAVAAEVANCKKYVSIVSTINGGTNVDLTSFITNPSFENGLTGWTNTGNMVTQGNTSFGKTGNNYVEFWQPNGTKGLSQTISLLPSGLYELTVDVKARGVSSAKVFAGGNEKAVKIADEQNTYVVDFAVDDKVHATIGFEGVGTGAGSSWLALDNFTLKYVGGLPDVEAVTGKMNATVAQAQTDAIANYNSEKTAANYNAAVNAIAAAQASKDAYTDAATAITAANALKEAHNFASAAATTTFAEAIAAINNAYTDNSLTTDAAAAAGTTLGTALSGWRGNPNGAAVKYLNDGFSLNDYDQALYVNTWSTEGESDGSNFKVPFYEYWTADANSLAENTWTGTLTNLPNGLYSVSALVRVRAKNEIAATDATGITMDVNGNGEGEYAAVDVTEGEQIGESQFQYATYTAKGLVKDGNLTLNFNVADGNNVSWLCFKNVKYTKVRDLTPEEAAIVPTAIALKVGDDEVTEPIALNATNNTVTLTVDYTPVDATEGVTWVSSDETVATVVGGVVTGVAPGTTTIKATSTLDENVNATATVTVTYPETEVVASSYVNDGATRTVVTLGENLIKNGSFEYPNGYYGWTDATNAAAQLNSTNFDIVTENDNKYLRSKNHGGSSAASSIGTAWPIENGKTYIFGYRTKTAKSGGSTEFQKVSLTNTLGTETSVISTTQSLETTWSEIKYEFTNSSNYAYVQFRARWLGENGQLSSFDDFYLQEVTDESTQGNVDYATAAIPTANIGTGAFQYSQDAIDDANALVQGTATVEEVQNAYDALTTINEPSNGQLFNVILTYSGWTYDQKAITYLANARNDGGYYNIQYKEPANVNLAQAFTFTKVSGNNYKMSQIDADGNVRYISTGVPYGGNTGQIRTTTDASKALVVTVIPTATEGKWNLRNTEANQFIGSQDAGVFTVNSHIDFNIVETTKPSIEINTTAAGWGTVMLPFAQELPAEVKAYTCDATENDRLTLTEVNALEANKPYLIEGAWDETVTGDAQGTALTYTEGLFTGVYADQDAPVDSYVLQNKKEKLGFYRVAEGKQPTVGSNHAYLTVEAASARDAFFFGEGETTAISTLKALSEGTVEIYNLNGVKQSKLQKGTNILKMSDGSIRKVMVK
jgi:hypothetical protein